MKDAASQTIYLEDYKPPAFLVDDVHLTFQMDPRKTRVISRISFRPNPQSGERKFTLHGEALTLISAKIDGKDCNVSVENGILTLRPRTNRLYGKPKLRLARKPTPRWKVFICQTACIAPNAKPKGFAKSPITLIARM